MYKGNVLFVMIALCGSLFLKAQSFVSEQPQAGGVTIVSSNAVATIYTDAADEMTVQKAASFLQQDIAAVTGKNISIAHAIPSSKNIILIGSIEGSSMIRQLIAQRKVDVSKIKGKWEAYLIQVVA